MHTLGIDFQHIVGVSGGSIVDALQTSYVTLEQIKQLAMDTSFKKLRGSGLLTLIFHSGLSLGDAIERWIDAQLQGKLFSKIEKYLHILAIDVNGGPTVFNKRSSPDLKISSLFSRFNIEYIRKLFLKRRGIASLALTPCFLPLDK